MEGKRSREGKIERRKIDLPLPRIREKLILLTKEGQVTVRRGFDMSYKSIYLNISFTREKKNPHYSRAFVMEAL